MGRRVKLVAVTCFAASLVFTASSAHATVLWEFDSGAELSFSWMQEVFNEDFFVFNDPYDGNPDGPLSSLTEPAGCNVFQVVVDADGFVGTIPGGNEIEVFGTPFCFFNFGFGDQRFTQLGTYTSGSATLTISEVPDSGPTWLLGAISLSALLVRRRRLA